MYLTKDRVADAMLCAMRVLQNASIFAGDATLIPISVDEIRDFVAAETGWTIEMEEVSYPQGKYILGRLEKWPNKVAKIHVRSDLGLEWKRVVATKELCQLLVDTEGEDLCPYGDETLETLVLEGHIGILCEADEDGSKSQTELTAEIAAMEILYPLDLRLKDKDEPDFSHAKLALRYRLPDGIVSTLFNGRYLGLVHKAMVAKRAALEAEVKALSAEVIKDQTE